MRPLRLWTKRWLSALDYAPKPLRNASIGWSEEKLENSGVRDGIKTGSLD
jgi:hypothetical protein